eukprot:TRINITY_DN4958_c1_g1_i1.p1 TRINITY_DN4958_c1_g1~~TRINITY_DN4958_c1_g1_i1.p1  ORF type:complete len:646 (+),score=190.04 TRINITY_DN4958_c1_g1_i1:155-1939(+)
MEDPHDVPPSQHLTGDDALQLSRHASSIRFDDGGAPGPIGSARTPVSSLPPPSGQSLKHLPQHSDDMGLDDTHHTGDSFNAGMSLLDASPIAVQRPQMDHPTDPDTAVTPRYSGGPPGHLDHHMGHAGANMSADSYGDILAEIDGMNFATAAPNMQEGDYLPTESSDLDIAKLSVGERLYYIGCGMERNKQERLRRERENRVVSELSQVTAKPMITQRARQMSSKGVEFAEKSVLWSKRLENERRKQSAKQCMETMAETLEHVQMNPRSAALLEKGRLKATYKGPVKGWNTHFARYQTKKNIVPEREVFAPNINTSSATLHREGVVGDRLHDEAFRKTERLRDMMDVASMQELVDPQTGKPYFQPSTVRSHSRDIDTVVNTLLSKGQEAAQKRTKRSQETMGKEYTFRPHLNPRSKEIATARGRKPLYDPSKFSKRGEGAGGQDGGKGGPKRASSSMPSYGIGTQSFHRRNERLLLNRQERVRAIKHEQEQRELEHCTFAPRICRQSEDILTQGQALSGAVPLRSRSAERPVPPSPAVGARAGNTSGVDMMPARMMAEDRSRWGAAENNAEPHVTSFEKEMLSVLEEWRKLEEV